MTPMPTRDQVIDQTGQDPSATRSGPTKQLLAKKKKIIQVPANLYEIKIKP